MTNRALYALWIIAGLGGCLGIILTTGGPNAATFGPDDYTPVFIGSGLLSLAVMCAVGALVAMAVGWYVQHPQPLASAPKKRPDSYADPGEPFLDGQH